MFIYQYVVTVLLALIGLNFLLNCLIFRKPRAVTQSPSSFPLVSVLIPARNEEKRLGPCLESLLVQRHANLEILVLDDHSSDGTKGLVESFSIRDSRVRLLQGEALPDSWTGKGWACEQLGKNAKGEWLLFTDADTWHHPATLQSALHGAIEDRSDLLSLWPRQAALSWSEISVIPFVHLLLLFFLPHWMPGSFRSLGAANGQFLFFRAEAYRAVGGHKSVKGHLVDDVALAREIKQKGMRLANRDGSALVHCRMYENAEQLWEGFTKNLRAGCEGSLAGFLFLTGIQFIALFLPFFLLFLSHWVPALWAWSAGQVLFILWLRLVLALKCGQPLLSVLLHPLGQLFVLAIALNSWRKTSRGEVTWKGRTYGA